MNISNKRFASIIFAFLAIALSTGCTSMPTKWTPAALSISTPIETPPPSTSGGALTVTTPMPDKTTQDAKVNADKKSNTLGNVVQPAGNNNAGDLPSTKGKNGDITEAYSSLKPTLMGLALTETKEQLLARYDKPKETYVMDEANDPITVYEYGDFCVGFDGKGTMQYIEIESPKVNPGLNGLMIGQKSEDALTALGKPDSSSAYVLTYKTKTTVLKLDLDAKNQMIRSIKLFGRIN
jgi:hypothetical protein